MTRKEMAKLEKAKWRYQLHDDIGCIREFKEKDSALQWKATRQELKLVVVKTPKFDIRSVTETSGLFDIPF